VKLERRKFGKRQASNDAVQSAAEERVKETSNRVYQLVASPLHLCRNFMNKLGGSPNHHENHHCRCQATTLHQRA
jgi:hypothetical protein